MDNTVPAQPRIPPAQIAYEERQHASKKLYEHIALQGNTVTITDVEVGFIARLLKEA